jgi:hypothetical protein
VSRRSRLLVAPLFPRIPDPEAGQLLAFRTAMKSAMKPFFLVMAAVLGLAATVSAQTDDPEITNEYRTTLVTSKPLNQHLILFGYLGIVKAPDKEVGTLYYSPPGIIYKPTPWMEVWAGVFGLYNNNETTSNSWELRPLGGVKFYVPNEKNLHIFNFTRYEHRFINQDHEFKTIPRIRNRIGIEAPLSRGQPWEPKTFYTLADFEPIWRLDEDRLQLARLRGGIGYILNHSWRGEFIYHAEYSGDPTQHTGNIWRLNFKWALPRQGIRHHVDVDE